MITLDILCRYPPLASLSGNQQVLLAGLAEDRRYLQGEAVFHEGQAAGHLYVLIEGRVGLYHNRRGDNRATPGLAAAMDRFLEDGESVPMLEGQADLFKEYCVGEVKPVELIGISVMLPPHRLTATARALSPSRVLCWDAPTLRCHCREDPALAYAMMTMTAMTAMQRLHATRQRLGLTEIVA